MAERGDRRDRGAHQHPDDGDVCRVKPEAARADTAGLDLLGQSDVRFFGRYWGQSGHAVLHCTCLLLTQSGHRANSSPFQHVSVRAYDYLPEVGRS